jgi:hypothetical protein
MQPGWSHDSETYPPPPGNRSSPCRSEAGVGRCFPCSLAQGSPSTMSGILNQVPSPVPPPPQATVQGATDTWRGSRTNQSSGLVKARRLHRPAILERATAEYLHPAHPFPSTQPSVLAPHLSDADLFVPTTCTPDPASGNPPTDTLRVSGRHQHLMVLSSNGSCNGLAGCRCRRCAALATDRRGPRPVPLH